MTTLYEALALAQLALDLGRVKRATYHEDGTTPETDTTHTTMVALVACSVAANWNLQTTMDAPRGHVFDVGRVAHFALVHDLHEAICGDTNSFALSPEEQREKEKREAKALECLIGENSTNQWLCYAISEYHKLEILEAQLVYIVDKLCPRLAHALNGGAAIRKMGINADGLEAKCAQQDAEFREKYPVVMSIVEQLLGAAAEISVTEQRGHEGRMMFRPDIPPGEEGAAYSVDFKTVSSDRFLRQGSWRARARRWFKRVVLRRPEPPALDLRAVLQAQAVKDFYDAEDVMFAISYDHDDG